MRFFLAITTLLMVNQAPAAALKKQKCINSRNQIIDVTSETGVSTVNGGDGEVYHCGDVKLQQRQAVRTGMRDFCQNVKTETGQQLCELQRRDQHFEAMGCKVDPFDVVGDSYYCPNGYIVIQH